jgi:preprotein translocase subunit SecB
MAKTPKKDAELDKLDADAPETQDAQPADLNISLDTPDAPPAAPDAPVSAPGGEAAGDPDAQSGAPMINVLAQYIKDLSFENPNAPDSLRSGLPQPEVAIDLRIGRQVNNDNQIEVSILLKAHATRQGATVFIAELDYAGLFAIQNIGMEQMQPLMMIECPRILFPFARKILADMTQDGGYPPVMLDMPDFASMFREEMMRRAQEQGLN